EGKALNARRSPALTNTWTDWLAWSPPSSGRQARRWRWSSDIRVASALSPTAEQHEPDDDAKTERNPDRGARVLLREALNLFEQRLGHVGNLAKCILRRTRRLVEFSLDLGSRVAGEATNGVL